MPFIAAALTGRRRRLGLNTSPVNGVAVAAIPQGALGHRVGAARHRAHDRRYARRRDLGAFFARFAGQEARPGKLPAGHARRAGAGRSRASSPARSSRSRTSGATPRTRGRRAGPRSSRSAARRSLPHREHLLRLLLRHLRRRRAGNYPGIARCWSRSQPAADLAGAEAGVATFMSRAGAPPPLLAISISTLLSLSRFMVNRIVALPCTWSLMTSSRVLRRPLGQPGRPCATRRPEAAREVVGAHGPSIGRLLPGRACRCLPGSPGT